MDRLIAYIRGFFYVFDTAEADLSSRWRPGANRRTSVVLAMLIVSICGVYAAFIRAPSYFPSGELVLVQDGVPLEELAENLEERAVVRSGLALRAVLLVTGSDRSVRAGDYLFKQPANLFAVARALATGAFGLEPVRITVAEGATVRTMASLYQSKLLRFNAARFMARAEKEEGYLFPDTYFFLPNATEETVMQTMRQNFDRQIEPYLEAIDASGHTVHEILTMASIIEREAHDYDDRRLISGVLWNRIEIGMALQVDATFLYQVGKNTFQLTLEDLATDSPYNTYVNKGLPPGPIGSPSLDAIQAAIQPTDNDYLFYLADMRGVTHYSKTYQEHLRKKRLYLGT